MSVGRRGGQRQQSMWIACDKVAQSPGHPFYRKLNEVLREEGFDRFAEDLCAPFFRDGGRPSIPPGVYFRMIMIGYFEGLSSERAVAWRCADSFSLREFLGLGLEESTPDHSSLSVWRKRLGIEVFEKVFQRVLGMIQARGLLSSKALGIDATTLEANAAMRSIVRKDTGASYRGYLEKLAREEGIENPSPEQLRRFDRKRKGKKTSNRDWESPSDPDSRVARMKDGTTHLAYKAEHAVDLESSVVVSATVQPADRGDPQSLPETLEEAKTNLKAAGGDGGVVWVVADRGYHKAELIKDLAETRGVWTCIPERDARGARRRWDGDDAACRAFHANRRRYRSSFGKSLMRSRGNIVERTFAHLLETGALRRVFVRGLENVRKRYLLHVLAYNLGVLMRMLFGMGTPRSPRDRRSLLFAALALMLMWLWVASEGVPEGATHNHDDAVLRS